MYGRYSSLPWESLLSTEPKRKLGQIRNRIKKETKKECQGSEKASPISLRPIKGRTLPLTKSLPTSSTAVDLAYTTRYNHLEALAVYHGDSFMETVAVVLARVASLLTITMIVVEQWRKRRQGDE